MKIKLVTLVAAMFVSVLAYAGPGVGDQAPDFELVGSDGKTYTLAQFRGVKSVVIAFFPKAFTGG